MKLQNLAIIFLVIAIPLILLMSYYINLQRTTLELQTSYNDKLTSVAETAIQAFEINTIEWNEKYSEEADSKRRDIEASINAFVTNLSNNMGITGTSKELMLNYVPAIIYTLSDGYYAYYKTYNVQTLKNDDGVQLYYHDNIDHLTTDGVNGHIAYQPKDGVSGITGKYLGNNGALKIVAYTLSINDAKYEYEYTLRPFVKYSAEYKSGVTDIIVNYTMNNYIKIYGKIGQDIVETAGFLVYFDNNLTKLPQLSSSINQKVTETKYNGVEIKPETLKEQIYVDGEIEEYTYIYNIKDEKVYYDAREDEFFRVNNGEKVFLNETVDAEYRSISILDASGEKYIKIYQSINGTRGIWYIDNAINAETHKTLGDLAIGDGVAERPLTAEEINGFGLNEIAINQDCSAINYYVEAYAFTKFVKSKFGLITIENMVDFDSEKNSNKDEKIFDIGGDAKNPENETSYFVTHKREVMKQCIKNELAQIVKGYQGELNIPEMSYAEWEQSLSNVSIIAYMQGIPIGLKTYNNYVVATSTKNKEFVSDYCINYNITGDTYYHSLYCDKGAIGQDIIGYKNIEFVRKRYYYNDKLVYYYMHSNKVNSDSSLSCYYCTVNSANCKEVTSGELYNKYEKAYYTALAREKYKQYEKIITGIIITYDANLKSKVGADGSIINHITNVENVTPNSYFVNFGDTHLIIPNIPKVTTDVPEGKLEFIGWTTDKSGLGTIYNSGQELNNVTSAVTLYAQWQLSIESFGWTIDNVWKSEYRCCRII